MFSSHKIKKILAITLLTSTFQQSLTIDRVHFHTANPFWCEPRFEKPYLLSIDINGWRGSTCEGYGKCNQKQNILNIYGLYNMKDLGKNVPDKDPNLIENIVLDELQQIESNNCFGNLAFSGKLRTAGTKISFVQNFTKGFFGMIHVPIRILEIRNICYTDLSPDEPATPNKTNTKWQAFLAGFIDILNLYDLNIKSCRQKGFGDLSILAGWTKNYEDTEYLDFIDWTVKAGILFPSGKEQNINNVFSLPIGYNGHWGMPMFFDLSIGLYEWLTFGTHLQILPLFNRTKTIHMKTDTEQSGMIKLAKGSAKIKPGLVSHLGFFIQADHIARGLSLTTGYSYAHQGNYKILPCEPRKFNTTIANTDEQLKKWSIHTIHFKADYDFMKEKNRIGARIGFFVDWHAGGKRTFKTNRSGVLFGIDCLLKS